MIASIVKARLRIALTVFPSAGLVTSCHDPALALTGGGGLVVKVLSVPLS